jgi:hypothetical protein
MSGKIRVIALTGFAGVGKSTVAGEILSAYKSVSDGFCAVMSFATPVKQIAGILTGLYYVQLNDWNVKASPVDMDCLSSITYRELLIKIGTDFRQCLPAPAKDDLWCEVLLRRIGGLLLGPCTSEKSVEGLVVIDDLRFVHELNYLVNSCNTGELHSLDIINVTRESVTDRNRDLSALHECEHLAFKMTNGLHVEGLLDTIRFHPLELRELPNTDSILSSTPEIPRLLRSLKFA